MNSIRFALAGLVVTFLALSGTTASAQWTSVGPTPSGYAAWRAPDGKTWTVAIAQVPSSDQGQSARARLAAEGYRMPSFVELQNMYNHQGGGPFLRIRNSLFDYYETSDPQVLGNAAGNGFQTPQRRLGVGNNWFIGVRP